MTAPQNGSFRSSSLIDCDTEASYQYGNVTACESCRQNGLNEYLKATAPEEGSKLACNPPASFPSALCLSPLSSCDSMPFHFCLFHVPSVRSCVHIIIFACNPSPSLLPFSRCASPMSFLFHALSDMSQGSSDEDSEEEDEDFSRVQFGSRYTATRCGPCISVCVGSVSAACPVGPRSLPLTAHRYTRVPLAEYHIGHGLVWLSDGMISLSKNITVPR